jgi:hypothetical protein
MGLAWLAFFLGSIAHAENFLMPLNRYEDFQNLIIQRNLTLWSMKFAAILSILMSV